jgi:hypothetical protein
MHESGEHISCWLRRRAGEAAQNPLFRQPCKYLNLRSLRLGVSAARKHVLLGILAGTPLAERAHKDLPSVRLQGQARFPLLEARGRNDGERRSLNQ